MQCKTLWSASVIATCGLPKDFVQKVMRSAREQVLWEREQALLPGTQDLATAVRLAEALASDPHADARDVEEARARVRRLEAGLPPDGTPAQILQRCPSCPGFITSKDFRCGLCNAEVCRRCRAAAASASTHRCDPATLATVAALASDTKPCPKCAVPIFRIYGCDQMFCTMCHTAFSWESGEVMVGKVHNPHFFEATRLGKAAVLAADSVAKPLAVDVGKSFSALEADLPPLGEVLARGSSVLSACRRLIIDLRATGKTSRPKKDNAMLRAAYLLGRVTQVEFKRKLFVGERARLRASDQAIVLSKFCEDCASQLRAGSSEAILQEARVQCNKALEGVCAYAGGKPPSIAPDFSGLVR